MSLLDKKVPQFHVASTEDLRRLAYAFLLQQAGRTPKDNPSSDQPSSKATEPPGTRRAQPAADHAPVETVDGIPHFTKLFDSVKHHWCGHCKCWTADHWTKDHPAWSVTSKSTPNTRSNDINSAALDDDAAQLLAQFDFNNLAFYNVTHDLPVGAPGIPFQLPIAHPTTPSKKSPSLAAFGVTYCLFLLAGLLLPLPVLQSPPSTLMSTFDPTQSRFAAPPTHTFDPFPPLSIERERDPLPVEREQPSPLPVEREQPSPLPVEREQPSSSQAPSPFQREHQSQTEHYATKDDDESPLHSLTNKTKNLHFVEGLHILMHEHARDLPAILYGYVPKAFHSTLTSFTHGKVDPNIGFWFTSNITAVPVSATNQQQADLQTRPLPHVLYEHSPESISGW